VVEIEPASALPFARYDVAMRAVDEAFADAAGEVLVFAFVVRLGQTAPCASNSSRLNVRTMQRPFVSRRTV